MALLPLMLHWLYILLNKSSGIAGYPPHQSIGTVKIVTANLIFSLVECVVAGLLTLLSTEPKGTLKVVSCDVKQLSDWYTMFFNPQIKYTQVIHCTQEAVYPLMSFVFIYYAYSLTLMLLFRPLVMSFIAPSKRWRDFIYAAMYFHPILVTIHAFAGGLIYFAFPYITIISSLVSLAAYFVWTEVNSINTLLERYKLLQNMFVVFCHFVVLAYGIITISVSKYYFVALVPVPITFYFLTIKFSNPKNISKETQS